MSYDTDHVRNVGERPETITGLHALTELVDNADLAGIYTAIRSASTATGPELVERTDVSKKTVYEYLRKLKRVGLISEVGDEGGATRYVTEEFTMTLTVRDVAVSITPELVASISYRDEYPVIERVLEDSGILTFALAYDLVKAHNDGDTTIRQIADLTGLSPGTTYDIVDAFYRIRDLGDDDPTPTTYLPDDVNNEQEDAFENLDDR